MGITSLGGPKRSLTFIDKCTGIVAFNPDSGGDGKYVSTKKNGRSGSSEFVVRRGHPGSGWVRVEEMSFNLASPFHVEFK